MFCERDYLRADGMVLLYEYFDSQFKPVQKSGEKPREGQALCLPSQPIQLPWVSQPRMQGTGPQQRLSKRAQNSHAWRAYLEEINI